MSWSGRQLTLINNDLFRPALSWKFSRRVQPLLTTYKFDWFCVSSFYILQQSNQDLVRLSELCRTAINISFLYLRFAEEQSVPYLVNHNITWEQLRFWLIIHTLPDSNKDLVWFSTLCRRTIRMMSGCPHLCRWSFRMMFGYPHFEGEQIRFFWVTPNYLESLPDPIWQADFFQNATMSPF